MKTFDQIYAEVQQRQQEMPTESRTTQLLQGGVHTIGKKIVEEAAEVWMAAEYQQDSELALEISQLLYHCAVIAVARGIDLNQIYENL